MLKLNLRTIDILLTQLNMVLLFSKFRDVYEERINGFSWILYFFDTLYFIKADMVLITKLTYFLVAYQTRKIVFILPNTKFVFRNFIIDFVFFDCINRALS